MISEKIRLLVLRSSISQVLLSLLGVGVATPVIAKLVSEYWKEPVIYVLLTIILAQIVILGYTISKLTEAANREDLDEADETVDCLSENRGS